MKKIYSIISIFALAALVLTSCGNDTRKVGATLMTNQDDINTAVEYVKSKLNETDVVVKVVFIPEADKGVVKTANLMRVYYYENGNKENLTQYLFSIVKGGKGIAEQTHTAGYSGLEFGDGVKFGDIDFSGIAGYIKTAGELVVAASDLYEEPTQFSGVSQYAITFAGDAKKGHHEFSIESVDDETSTSAVDNYYEVVFEVVDGELVSDEVLTEEDLE